MISIKEEVKVSIITPCYNSEEYLEETIISVLNQTYQNIEYIIIDGGSTDGTLDIIKKYSDRLTFWISEKDYGQSDAINKGYKKATGELVTWIGSDDLLNSKCIEFIVTAYKQNPEYSIYYGKINIINTQSKEEKIAVYKYISFETLVNKDGVVVQPGSFCNNKFIMRSNFVDPQYHYCMDLELWLYLSQYGRIKYIDELLATFRLHPLSKSFKDSNQFNKEKRIITKKYGRFCFSKLSFLLIKCDIKSFIKWKI